MRIIQFMTPNEGRRVGVVEGDVVLDLTRLQPEWRRVYDIFFAARKEEKTFEQFLSELASQSDSTELRYVELLNRRPGEGEGWILPPIDHPDPAHCTIEVTGLTHLGSMAQRDKMHQKADSPKTDSEKMFQMGLKGGKPEPGVRGVQSEWCYKGTGVMLRGHNDFLDIPAYAEDGGEEPEVAGCYIIADDGVPYRVGFTIGNEWSDHGMERINYLYLGHSKMRNCSIGPELITGHSFKDIRGLCRIYRGEEVLYDSGELLTGEENMNHSLANLEDHLFKHPQLRVPGDVHIYFYGTMKFSFGSRGPLEDGDRVEITFGGMGSPLNNYVRRISPDPNPVLVKKA